MITEIIPFPLALTSWDEYRTQHSDAAERTSGRKKRIGFFALPKYARRTNTYTRQIQIIIEVPDGNEKYSDENGTDAISFAHPVIYLAGHATAQAMIFPAGRKTMPTRTAMKPPQKQKETAQRTRMFVSGDNIWSELKWHAVTGTVKTITLSELAIIPLT